MLTERCLQTYKELPSETGGSGRRWQGFDKQSLGMTSKGFYMEFYLLFIHTLGLLVPKVSNNFGSEMAQWGKALLSHLMP